MDFKNRNILYPLLTLFMLLFSFSQSYAAEISILRSGYNEPCNKTQRCKSQNWFSCNPETHLCHCARKDEMIFDAQRDKCVSMIGERCKFGFDENEEGFSSSSWYGKTDCVRGGICGPSGTCSCPRGTFQNQLENTCSPVRNYGQSCQESSECNQDKFLSCVSGLCTCDPDNAVYNPQNIDIYDRHYGSRSIPGGICLGRVGARCSSDEGKYCIKNSVCSGGTCGCQSGYSETSERLCGLGYLQDCSDTTVCSDKLRCSTRIIAQRGIIHSQDVKCQCPFPKYQEYDDSVKSCRGLVGSPCDPNDLSCVDKAICTEKENIFSCECSEGFIENKGGKCEIGHGTPCDYITGTVPLFQVCDTLANLRCKGRKCSCEDDADLYETKRRQCSAPVGLRCQNDTQCVSNAFCRKEFNHLDFGRCSCQDGFKVTKNHTCVSNESGNIHVPTTGNPLARVLKNVTDEEEDEAWNRQKDEEVTLSSRRWETEESSDED